MPIIGADPTAQVAEVDQTGTTYATRAQFKAAIRLEDTVDDDAIDRALGASARMIDDHCHRRFWLDAEPVSRYFDGARCDSIYVDDIGSLTDLAVAVDQSDDGMYSDAWTNVTHYRLLPRNAAADSRPWTELQLVSGGGKSWPYRSGAVRVTARFGWPAIPAPIEQANIIQASRLFKRPDSPFGVAGVAELGSELRLLARLDPDVQALVAPYWLPVLA